MDSDLNPLPENFARLLVQRGLGRFIFSIYSNRPEVHNSITRYQSFFTTVTALQNAVKSDVPVEIHFVAMRRNFRTLLDLVDAAEAWGVRKVSVLRFVPHGRAGAIASGEDLKPEEMRELREIIVSARKTNPNVELRAGSPYNVLGIGITPCDAAQEVLIVNHRADIFPCDAFKNVAFNDARFGSVLTHSLKDVWERSTFLNRVREELATRPGPMCESCAEMYGCKSGCLAQKVIRNGWGDTSEPDPSCVVQIADTDVPDRRQAVRKTLVHIQ
jgi:radical SAM protein with 4Fe4S-binding SPASM domain